METTLKVKDFIIDIPKTIENITNGRASRGRSQSTFEVILENNTDFVINRKTAMTDKNLVFLISQGLFYIKNNKNEDIETITEQKLRSFFQGIYYDNFEDFTKVQWWNNNSPENKIEPMMKIITNPIMQNMYQHNIFPSKYEFNDWKDAFETNIKLFRYCYDKIINSKVNKNYFKNILKIIIEINNKISFNNATIFIDKVAESEIGISLYKSSYKSEDDVTLFLSLIDKYSLNFTRFIDYICDDLHSQGITSLSSDILTLYRDYLKMQISLYGKVKEKYPKHLKTEHDVITLKFNTYEKFKKDLMIFNVADKYKDLEWMDKEYIIVTPKSATDIIDEGISMSSCVGSYIDNVIKCKSMILFMRNINDINKSLVTIEVNENREIIQAKGFANKIITDEEKEFVIK